MKIHFETNYPIHTRRYPKRQMGNSAKNSGGSQCSDPTTFHVSSICCKGEINVQIVSDDEKDLEPGVLRANCGKGAVYRRAKVLYPKVIRKENGNKA